MNREPCTIITGAAGFIGSHLARLLAAGGERLILIDDLSTGRIENIQPLLTHHGGRCTFIRGRVGHVLSEQPRWLQNARRLFHLAASVGVMLVMDDPAAMIHNNVGQTETVLAACARHHTPVLIASSSEVYGLGLDPPLREDQQITYGPTTAARWAYGMTKAIDEHLALDYHRTGRLGVVIVRLFNTIGPRQLGRYGMVVPRFVQRAVAGEPLEVFGDGAQRRTFCDVRDVTPAMVALLDDPANHGEVFNLGSDHEISIDALADRVIELTGSTAGKQYVAYEQAYGPDFEDPPRRVPDLTKIRNAIGFRPAYSLDKTLADLIAEHQAATPADPVVNRS